MYFQIKRIIGYMLGVISTYLLQLILYFVGIKRLKYSVLAPAGQSFPQKIAPLKKDIIPKTTKKELQK